MTHTFVFLGIWYFFTIISNESHIPSGLLVPGMITGAAIGSIYNEIRIGTFGWDSNPDSSAPIFLGAAAFVASYTPMTYSLAVLVMETTNSFTILIPVLIAMQVSQSLSRLIVDYSIYDRGLRLKNIPLLRQQIPISS